MAQILCKFCQTVINDEEYIAITGPDTCSSERRANELICHVCAKKFYPELYKELYSET